MAEEDATVRLPGDRARADNRYATDQYDGSEPAERGFGGEYPAADPTTRFEAGYAPSYPPDDRGEDRTLTLAGSGDAWAGYPPPVRTRDRVLVHLVWEVLLFVLVAGLAVGAGRMQSGMFSADGLRGLEILVAGYGLLAVAVSVSLRAAAPNLAVGGIAVLAGVLFARWYGHGTVTSLALAIGVGLLGGLAMGVVIGLFQVPGWAVSLVALCGTVVAVAALRHGHALALPDGARLPSPLRNPAPVAIVVLAASVVLGVLGMVAPLRRALGSFRRPADAAERPGPGAAVMVAVATTLSSGLAAAAGVLVTWRTGTAGTTPLDLSYLLLPLGAVLLGGVSAYGRRGGMVGTALGVLAVCLALEFGTLRGWPSTVTTYAVAGGAIFIGLVVTRLVEWAGRPRPDDLV